MQLSILNTDSQRGVVPTYFQELLEIIIIANSPNKLEEECLNEIKLRIETAKIVKVARESLYASWNRGIKLSTGEAICFWNVDDIRFGRALIDGLRKIEKGADIVYFPFLIFKKHKYFKYMPIYSFFLLS